MYWLKNLIFLLGLLSHRSTVTCQALTSSADAAAKTGDASSSAREPITRVVQVAKGGHTFVPDVTQAEVGDLIQFRFFPTNHSVVRAAYEYPCIPYEMVETDKVGFTSGFLPVDAILDDPPIFEIRVNDTDPVFYYCSAPGSCIDYGMVGVINPSASMSLERQRSKAKDSDFMLQPGQKWPNEADAPPKSSSDSPSSEDSKSTSSSQSSTESDSTASSEPALSPGGIAGIAIGSAVVILLAAVLIYFCGRDRSLSHLVRPRRNTALPGEFDNGGVQYVQAMPKHQSGMTMASSLHDQGGYVYHSPALPGYNGPSERVYSPPRQHYQPSDALSPAIGLMRSPSPGSSVVPAYSKSPTMSPQSHLDHPVDGLHEMDAGQEGGTQRFSSTRKIGVERYT